MNDTLSYAKTRTVVDELPGIEIEAGEISHGLHSEWRQSQEELVQKASGPHIPDHSKPSLTAMEAETAIGRKPFLEQYEDLRRPKPPSSPGNPLSVDQPVRPQQPRLPLA